ncbi:RING finger protein [Zostera marina]|uniref:E3 ubiquitin-protein ligase RNF170 n=1 Tax=Zostera marina TaxID=29655 RepID=A0A0K9P714_ZOSMR|nr:RING finger protein [Zostera marina]
MEMASPPEEDFCSICHDNFSIPYQANCSHWFCGECILRVWQHGSVTQPCNCPICRRKITLLVPFDAAIPNRNESDISTVSEYIAIYNRQFGQDRRPFIQFLRDLPFFIRRMLLEFIDPQRLPFFLKIRMWAMVILSFLYLLSPVDIISEAAYGIVGLLDDLLIFLILFLHCTTLYRTLLVYRHGQGG